MNKSNKKIEGFDIFDTVLSRSVSPPQALFIHFAKHLLKKYHLLISAEFFSAQRQAAEVRCMKNLGHRATIYHIYHELADTLLLSDELRDQILKEEIEFEKQNTFVVPEIKTKITDARSKGRHIVFVSDMYFPEAIMRELLSHHNIIEKQDAIYVSCDYNANKYSGKLFKHALQKEGIKPHQMVFHGNKKHIDIRPARLNRINAIHFDSANSNRFEQAYEKHNARTNGLSSKFSGASRKTRLSIPARNSHQKYLRDVAAGVAAPMLVSYVSWVLSKAEKLGIKRLYFLSRDGQVLLEVARKIKEKLSINIELRYLYASRLSWNRCAEDENTQGWIWHDVEKSTSLKDILSRVSITYDDVSSELSKYGFTKDALKSPISKRQLKKLQSCFENKQFQEKIANIRAVNRNTLDNYLEQEGLFDSTNKGIVDIGWIGTLHETLSGFLESKNAPPAHCFLYGLKWYDTKWKNYRHGFHFDYNRRLGPRNPLSFNGLLVIAEVFCAADHGTVYGFENTSNGIQPRLGEGWTRHTEEWGFSLYRQVIMQFTDALDIDEGDAEKISIMRESIDDAMKLFWSHPTKGEAKAWGKFPWDAGQGSEDVIIPLAEPVNINQLFKLLFLQTTTIQNHNISWVEASVKLSPLHIRLLYKGIYQWNLLAQKTYKFVKQNNKQSLFSKKRINANELYLGFKNIHQLVSRR